MGAVSLVRMIEVDTSRSKAKKKRGPKLSPFKLSLQEVFTALEEEMDDDSDVKSLSLDERVPIVRQAIAGLFHRQTVPDLRKYVTSKGNKRRIDETRKQCAENSLRGCWDASLRTLATRISKEISLKHPMLAFQDLPKAMRTDLRRMQRKDMPAWALYRIAMDQVPDGWTPLVYVLWSVRIELITVVLEDMLDKGEIEYCSLTNVWQMQQSVVDEMLRAKAIARKAMKPASVKQDDRSYHGRSRNQARRRNTREGVSIGGAA
jgi:hypothetical protein